MGKSLQTAKIEELQKIYKRYKQMYRLSDTTSSKESLKWVKTVLKDLKWLLDDETY